MPESLIRFLKFMAPFLDVPTVRLVGRRKELVLRYDDSETRKDIKNVKEVRTL